MKIKLISVILGLFIVAAAPTVNAQITIGFGIGFDSCGYPDSRNYSNYPGNYRPCPAYGPPVGVYLGDGGWGNGRQFRGGRDFRGGRGAPPHREGRRGR
ncbi:hypothetical protein [Undibacterium sp. SXout20W]|uniref:hypothetical protein n=1 Tax=Undibacterium sp. SXout20W TaxID=3413051 RepID=UPI003BF3A0C7